MTPVEAGGDFPFEENGTERHFYVCRASFKNRIARDGKLEAVLAASGLSYAVGPAVCVVADYGVTLFSQSWRTGTVVIEAQRLRSWRRTAVLWMQLSREFRF
jgi:ribose 1,5-bisphosphokinase PhnN